MTENNTSFLLNMNREKYDENVAPYLDSIKNQYIKNDGKYKFIMSTLDNGTVYVIPDKLGLPNEAESITIVFENGTQLIKSELERLTKN